MRTGSSSRRPPAPHRSTGRADRQRRRATPQDGTAAPARSRRGRCCVPAEDEVLDPRWPRRSRACEPAPAELGNERLRVLGHAPSSYVLGSRALGRDRVPTEEEARRSRSGTSRTAKVGDPGLAARPENCGPTPLPDPKYYERIAGRIYGGAARKRARTEWARRGGGCRGSRSGGDAHTGGGGAARGPAGRTTARRTGNGAGQGDHRADRTRADRPGGLPCGGGDAPPRAGPAGGSALGKRG